MNHYFNNIDIPFSIGGCNFHAVNIISSSIDTDIPLHTHGVNREKMPTQGSELHSSSHPRSELL